MPPGNSFFLVIFFVIDEKLKMGRILTEYEHKSLLSALFESSEVTSEDIARWYNQSICFSKNSKFGLSQTSGGPCGVLVVIQGFLLARLLYPNISLREAFENGIVDASPQPFSSLSPSPTDQAAALTHTLSFVLWLVASVDRPNMYDDGSIGTIYIVTSASVEAELQYTSPHDEYRVHEVDSLATLESIVSSLLPFFTNSANGLLFFVMSIMLTRGVKDLQADSDVQDSLVVRHGHSSQELLNFVLTGRAISGIFDGIKVLSTEHGLVDMDSSTVMDLNSDLKLRGVTRRPLIGFLTIMETRNMQSAGEYFKNPLYPIWVVGGESHYSLLFGLSRAVIDSTPSAPLRSLFRSFEVTETQFVSPDQFPNFCMALSDFFGPSELLEEVQGNIMNGERDFLLWSEFWDLIAPVLQDHQNRVLNPELVKEWQEQLQSKESSDVRSKDAPLLGNQLLNPEDVKGLLEKSIQMNTLLIENQFITAGQLPPFIKTVLPERYYDKFTETVLTRICQECSGEEDLDSIIFLDSLFSNLLPALEQHVRAANEEFSKQFDSSISSTAPSGRRDSSSSTMSVERDRTNSLELAKVQRTFPLIHYNGLSDEIRKPCEAHILVHQRDAGNVESPELSNLAQMDDEEAQLSIALALSADTHAAEEERREKLQKNGYSELEGIIRTKWTDATVEYVGDMPKLE